MSTRSSGWRRRRLSVHFFLISSAAFTGLGLLILTLRSIDPSTDLPVKNTPIQTVKEDENLSGMIDRALNKSEEVKVKKNVKNCATVEEMGEIFSESYRQESLRVRRIIQNHFALNGASRVRGLPPDQFCRHGFVIGKASEAGLGNEMYKILTAAALSVMLNRSLIIGQTRGKYPFEDYISYSNLSFTLKEVKHLWRQNGCLTKYGRHLVMRIDDFQKPARTNVLCSNWKQWDQPIIWFQNTTDAVAVQFFLKNIHSEMRKTASNLFGVPENLQFRPNVFGELMRVLISPSGNVERAVNWALNDGTDPDIVMHMRMLMNRSVRAVQAALGCYKRAVKNLQSISKPKVVLVSDTPSTVKDIAPNLAEFSEVLRFDYERYGNISGEMYKLNNINFRVKDWGPAPRWVAFVDFFLASRAKHAVISGANRRVGTTYAQLIAALAAANRLEENSSTISSIAFLSSFHSNLLSDGLRFQVGWGHIWNRFAGQLSCHKQPNQCAFTPLLPPAWWDGLWQSPLPRDIRRMEAYGIRLSGFGTFNNDRLNSFCTSRKNVVVSVPLI